MKHQILLKEIASMLQRQEMLTKLTESVCLEEYSYSETHCIDYIGKTELPNVTKIADNMQMTRGAISKMTKKLLAKGLIEKYSLESNKKEIYFRLTESGLELYKEHEKRHKLWEQRDSKFLERYSPEEMEIITKFMKEFNMYSSIFSSKYILNSFMNFVIISISSGE